MFKLFKKKHKCNYNDMKGSFYQFCKSNYNNEDDRVIVFAYYICSECGNGYKHIVARYQLPNTYQHYLTSEHKELFKKLEEKGIRDFNDHKIDEMLEGSK